MVQLRCRVSAPIAGLAAAALILAPILTAAAALAAAPPIASPAPVAVSDTANPPARVGRLAQITGTVSTHAQDATQWSPAVLNTPIVSGDAFWTEPQAQARLELAASAFTMSGGTELDITRIDDHAFAATLPQGELFIAIRTLPPGDTYAIATPRGTVQIATAGRYDIVAGDTADATTLTVVEGAAEITGPALALQVAANQTATVSGTDSFQGSVGAAVQTPFLTAMLGAAPQQVASQIAALPPAVQQMTGADDLAQYGRWSSNAQYGQVWYPNVAPGWTPYQDGQWDYTSSWGWNWVDSEPWGFAPFHYGRWAEIGGAWGWVPVWPGVVVDAGYMPVYAPALVSFIGFGAGLGWGWGGWNGWGWWGGAGGWGGWRGPVGWVPLAPGEPFVPWFRFGAGFFRSVNIINVRNINIIRINRNITINNFINRRAASVVPASAFVTSRRLGGVAHRVDGAQLRAARPILGRTPLRPGVETAGLTRPMARNLGIPSAALRRPAAAGPAFARGVRPTGLPALRGQPRAVAAAARAAGVGGPAARIAARQGTPPLRAPGAPRPSLARAGLTGSRSAGRSAQAAARPMRPGLPALRTPGAPRPVIGAGRGRFAATAAVRGPRIAADRPYAAGPALRAPAPQRLAAARLSAVGASRAALEARPATFRPSAPRPAAPTARPAVLRPPAYRAPAYRTPAYPAPALRADRAPTYRAPVHQASPYHAPAYQPPAYRAPAYRAPAYRAPAYRAPAYRAPAYQAPAYRPPAYHPAFPAAAVRAPAYRPPPVRAAPRPAPRFQPQQR